MQVKNKIGIKKKSNGNIQSHSRKTGLTRGEPICATKSVCSENGRDFVNFCEVYVWEKQRLNRMTKTNWVAPWVLIRKGIVFQFEFSSKVQQNWIVTFISIENEKFNSFWIQTGIAVEFVI